MPTNRSFNLMGLPTEILYEIAQRLRLRSDMRDPGREPLRDIAQPILHQHFPLMTSVGRDHARIFQFVRTLIERPDLAKGVRILGLDYSIPDRISFSSQFFKLLPPTGPALAAQYNLEHPSNGSDDGQILEFVRQLVLCLASEVHCVNVAGLTNHNIAFVHHTGIDEQHVPNSSLEKLTRLRVTGESFYPFPRQFSERKPSCLLLAHVTTLEMTYSTDMIHVMQGFTYPIHWDVITRLDFVFCYSLGPFFESILDNCPKLQQLTYISGDGVTAHDRPPAEWVRPSFYNVHGNSVTPSQIFQVFPIAPDNPLQDLRALVLEYPNEDWLWGPTLRPLTMLTSLEKIYLSSRALYGIRIPFRTVPLAEILPAGIRHLGIFQIDTYPRSISEDLANLAERVVEFPHLRHVTLHNPR
ncbi:hypothetical protein B0T22DRAFT_441864 [Podospora appendiculata]|uniref:Uncharacterized protein n=1 Tax=Podospora appendiculata TaxID=314037 RepID=A0AAE0XDH3_9PEZI|nr:hypothetical protein B0T22DRAFT_441864 [Podospora appendiculata]